MRVGGWGSKRRGRGVLGGIWRGRIKGVLRKRKDEKVMKDCQRAQVGKGAGLLVYIYLFLQEPKQNRWNIQLWPSSFLVSWVCRGLYASAIKRHLSCSVDKEAASMLTGFCLREHLCLHAHVQTRANEAKQYKSAELTATVFWGAPCLWFQTHADA